MKKKYQVFVSSTYKDLVEERAAVTKCLLGMDCIPVGMEQFPASDMSQMDYIKMMLDDCDYYILILAGKYGSCDSEGISFTEKEYDYAVSKGIPVMSFVINDTGKLIGEKCENSEKGQEKLQAFRDKVCKGRLVKFYTDIGALQYYVAISLQQCIKNFPAIGWRRGDAMDVADAIGEEIDKYKIEHASAAHAETFLNQGAVVLKCGNAGSDGNATMHSCSNITSQDVISVDGARKMVEELAKKIPKITMGKEKPKKLEDGEIYLQYE